MNDDNKPLLTAAAYAAFVERFQESIAEIAPLLHSKEQTAQGMILADLVSMWLVGHFVSGDPNNTAALREKIFQRWTELMRKLMPENDRLRQENLDAGVHPGRRPTNPHPRLY